ncbi:hypothetical protein EIP86_011412 [Pleurotus ostreatoroseus]|nr:hypothetical protein EIP86_011412 [Pleurotus ostreatoroseus]
MPRTFIAIEPPILPRTPPSESSNTQPETSAIAPPSFEHSQFDIILRHQRQRPRGGGGTKYTAVPSRFLHLSNVFEFSGWGTLQYLDLTTENASQAREQEEKISTKADSLGQFTASALAGNAVLGSVFYALPAVVAASSI